jgi:hypothetical protein
MQQELLEFEKRLLQQYLDVCEPESAHEKNALAIKFINENAAELREFFCSNFCKNVHNCPALKSTSKRIT